METRSIDEFNELVLNYIEIPKKQKFSVIRKFSNLVAELIFDLVLQY